MKGIRINESTTNIETVEINEQFFFKKENISSYTYDTNDLQTWNVIVDERISKSTDESELHEYFLIDTLFHEAFSHWVYESCIYLDAFLILYKSKPNLKLHLVEPKSYKKLFCTFFAKKRAPKGSLAHFM